MSNYKLAVILTPGATWTFVGSVPLCLCDAVYNTLDYTIEAYTPRQFATKQEAIDYAKKQGVIYE